ncbi:hypothetical protein M0802_012429 [Mischocyttarus mexicanus]|nr:hypothetical protein M0802_012429 [Mischocyttarus mexicanus]
MFAAQRKSIIDSKKSSDKEVECFKKRIINRISSNSSSDDEESYTSDDLNKLLEELAINESEKLMITADDSLDNIQWNKFANKQQ